MSMKSSIITYLNTKTGVTDLVGSRIRFGFSEQADALPRIVIHNIDNSHEHHLTAAAGFVQGRFQFDCFGETPLQALNVSEQLRLALDGFRGTMGDVYVSTCLLDSERDNTDQPVEGAHRGVYSVQQDYLLGWAVSVPTFA